MTKADDSADLGRLEGVERVLERFRPAGPPAELRARILAAAPGAAQQRPRRRLAVWLWRAGVAAGLLAAVSLSLAADHISTRIAAQIGTGPPVWTQNAEQAAQLLDGDGWGRQYLAAALRAGPLRPGPAWPATGIKDDMLYLMRQTGAHDEQSAN